MRGAGEPNTGCGILFCLPAGGLINKNKIRNSRIEERRNVERRKKQIGKWGAKKVEQKNGSVIPHKLSLFLGV
jgi:hypothetical protein